MLTIGERIKIARKAAALSLRALAEEVGVSAQAISKYENGLVTPNSTMLRKLARALGVKVEFFFRTQEITLERPAYRKRTALPKKQEEAIKGQIQEWLERYLEVEALFPPGELRSFCLPDHLDLSISSMEDVERLSKDLRDAWHLGRAPIEDLTALLESHGIKIHLVEGHDKFDACTFTLNGQIPVIVTKCGLSGDRQRFNIAHELGHFLMETYGEMASELDREKAAYRFAAAFLVPRQMAIQELGKQRHSLGLGELLILKHSYGLSIQAWIYRAKDLGIISHSTFRRLFQQPSTRHLRRNEPGDIPPEKTRRLEQLVHRALAEDLISRPRAAELLGKSLEAFFDGSARMPDESSILGGAKYAGNPTRVRH